MAHIHLPPAFFPSKGLYLLWSLALALLLLPLIVTRRRTIEIQQLAMAGVDMNLMPPIGISAGLGIGLLFIFIVKLLSAVVGHGRGRSQSGHDRELERDHGRILLPQNDKTPTSAVQQGCHRCHSRVACRKRRSFVLSCWFQADKEPSYGA
jgi:hypothetical protein